MAEEFFGDLWADIKYTFTIDLKAFDVFGWDYEIPFFWCWVVLLVIICVCIPGCCLCAKKKNKRGARPGGVAKAAAPKSASDDKAADMEEGNNPLSKKTEGSGVTKAAKRKSVQEAIEKGEKPPVAKQKSLRQSLSRGMSKMIGLEVEKWKKMVDEYDRPYYVNQDTGESAWEIPKGEGGKKPSPWIESVDEHQRKYFYNTETHESRWTDPEADCTDGLPAGWQIIPDSSGREYYYNATTGQSQWDKPTGTGSEIMQAAAPTERL